MVLVKAGGYQVRLCATEREKDQVRRLWATVYEQLGYLQPEAGLDGIRDDLSDRAVLLSCWKDGSLIGGVRVVIRVPPWDLEVERLCTVPTGLLDGRPAEVMKFMLKRDHRGGLAGLLLLNGVWRLCQGRGVDRILAPGKLGSLLKYYKVIGLHEVEGVPVFPYPMTGASYRLLTSDLSRWRVRLWWAGLFWVVRMGARLRIRERLGGLDLETG